MMTLPTAAAIPTPAFAHRAPPRPGGSAAVTQARRAAASLVLFVGETLRPGPALAAMLAREGMRSLWLAGPDQAVQAARLAHFDAVLLEGGTVEGSGAAAIALVREALACPLVVVADHADEIDEIVALELGADLFLARPLADRRLRAHLAALLRRQPAPPAQAAVPQWQLDFGSGRLACGERQVALTEVQSRLLQRLMQSRGHLVERAELVAALPQGTRLHERSLDVYVHRLRRRLKSQAVQGLAIEVVRGRGWVLAAPAAAARPDQNL
jgi:DNA-binding response OmpR family regulator